jgi:hypothetical protein
VRARLRRTSDLAGGVNVLLEVLGELPIDVDALVWQAATRPRGVVRRCG